MNAQLLNEQLLISFSGGRSSAYMTHRLLEEYQDVSPIICFANTGKENAGTLDFVNRCDELWGNPIIWLEYDPIDKFRIVSYETASRNGEPFESIIEKRQYLPNVVARICTGELKVRVIKRFMQLLGYKGWISALGIRHDEPQRWSKLSDIGNKECWNNWLPLVDWKVTKETVRAFWQKMPFDLQLKDHEGNCDLCFLKGKNKLKRIITEHPEKVDWWIRQEEKVNGRFHRNYSYRQLVDNIKKSPSLFDYEDSDFPCFCNID